MIAPGSMFKLSMVALRLPLCDYLLLAVEHVLGTLDIRFQIATTR